MTSQSITLEHQIMAPLQRVWRAWTDRESLCLWDPDRVEGDVVAGQSVVLYWDSLGAAMQLDVLACREEQELQLRSEYTDGSKVEFAVHLQALSSDRTFLRLTLHGLMDEDERSGSAAGWYTQLRILERYLERSPKRRASFAALGSAVVSLPRAYDALSTLGGWLSEEPVHLHKEGQRFSFTTRPTAATNSMPLSGEVIALVHGRELACYCNELDGVIRFRALPLAKGRARLLGVQVIRWGESDDALAVQEALHLGVERLIAMLSGPTGNA